MLDLLTRIIPFIVIIAVVVIFILRFAVWTRKKDKDDNPPSLNQ